MSELNFNSGQAKLAFHYKNVKIKLLKTLQNI